MTIDTLDDIDPPTTSRKVQRRELGAFLRSRRERIVPEQVGLRAGGRRRTPGLRREEVAAVAGVGVTWYTWLEQGRDIHVSDDVLDAIGRTLMFDPQERRHLYALAGSASLEPSRNCEVVRPAVQRMLDQLEPLPASVVNGRFDILAFNQAYGGLIGDLDALPVEDHNTLWLNLTHPTWKRAVLDRDDHLARCVAQLRGAMAQNVAEPAWKALVKRLSEASPEFVELWERREVSEVENRIKTILNDRVGALRLDYTSLWFGPNLGTRMVTYTPADDLTATRLDELAAMSRLSSR